MLRGPAARLTLLFGLVATLGAGAPLGEAEAKSAALRFGQALVHADTASLDSLLPRRGSVRLRLGCLGPEQGSFSAGQVQALLHDFLRQGSVRSFKLVRSEAADERYVLVHGAAEVVDRDGAERRVHLHLTFEPEEGRFVLREIRETPP